VAGVPDDGKLSSLDCSGHLATFVGACNSVVLPCDHQSWARDLMQHRRGIWTVTYGDQCLNCRRSACSFDDSTNFLDNVVRCGGFKQTMQHTVRQDGGPELFEIRDHRRSCRLLDVVVGACTRVCQHKPTHTLRMLCVKRQRDVASHGKSDQRAVADLESI